MKKILTTSHHPERRYISKSIKGINNITAKATLPAMYASLRKYFIFVDLSKSCIISFSNHPNGFFLIFYDFFHKIFSVFKDIRIYTATATQYIKNIFSFSTLGSFITTCHLWHIYSDSVKRLHSGHQIIMQAQIKFGGSRTAKLLFQSLTKNKVKEKV